MRRLHVDGAWPSRASTQPARVHGSGDCEANRESPVSKSFCFCYVSATACLPGPLLAQSRLSDVGGFGVVAVRCVGCC